MSSLGTGFDDIELGVRLMEPQMLPPDLLALSTVTDDGCLQTETENGLVQLTLLRGSSGDPDADLSEKVAINPVVQNDEFDGDTHVAKELWLPTAFLDDGDRYGIQVTVPGDAFGEWGEERTEPNTNLSRTDITFRECARVPMMLVRYDGGNPTSVSVSAGRGIEMFSGLSQSEEDGEGGQGVVDSVTTTYNDKLVGDDIEGNATNEPFVYRRLSHAEGTLLDDSGVLEVVVLLGAVRHITKITERPTVVYLPPDDLGVSRGGGQYMFGGGLTRGGASHSAGFTSLAPPKVTHVETMSIAKPPVPVAAFRLLLASR